MPRSLRSKGRESECWYHGVLEKLRWHYRIPSSPGAPGSRRTLALTWAVIDPAEWEWSSFRLYSLREVGRVEIELEWTALDREMLASGGSARLFLGPETTLSLSKS